MHVILKFPGGQRSHCSVVPSRGTAGHGATAGARIGRIWHLVHLLTAALFLSASSPLLAAPATEPAPREAYRKFAMTTPGDPEAGRRLFNEPKKVACANCHATDGKGGKVGPDLFAIGEKFGRTELIQQVLEPSATIAVGYSTTIIRTKTGDTFDGIVTETSEESIGLMGADGRLNRIRV